MREFENAGVIIRMEMVRCGYTAETLCEATELSPTVLRDILSGRKTSISTRNLCSMARVFGFGVSEFIDLLSGAVDFPPYSDTKPVQD